MINDHLIDLLESILGQDIMQHMQNDDVIEIMINPDKTLWIDTLTKGRIKTNITIEPQTTLNIINLVASDLGTVVTEEKPIISAELPKSKSRFQGMIPPVVENPCFTIRKKAIQIFTLDDYVKQGILSIKQLGTIKELVKNKQNILVVGGTSTGKTTLCNAIINEISNYNERLIIIEDTQELQSSSEDTVFMKTSDNVNMRGLLKSTMRFRPDRILVGEIRGAEALELLKAWNSGHPGGICTIHANNVKGGLEKLEQYIEETVASPQKKMIASTIDAIIVIQKQGLKRVITDIAKINGYKNGEYVICEI